LDAHILDSLGGNLCCFACFGLGFQFDISGGQYQRTDPRAGCLLGEMAGKQVRHPSLIPAG
jgi:hypothetical protein